MLACCSGPRTKLISTACCEFGKTTLNSWMKWARTEKDRLYRINTLKRGDKSEQQSPCAFVVMATGVLRLCAIAFSRTVSISRRPERELPSPRRPSLAPLRGLRPRARRHQATPAKRERVLIVAGIRKGAIERRQSGVGCLRCAL